MPDYFEFMGFPRQITLNDEQLQQKYFDLSREYHPDFHTQSDETGRQESLDRSSLLNQAYRTLKDPFDRARYLLTLEWPDLPDDARKQIPPALLMEVMEMQEKIAETRFEEDASRKEALRNELTDIGQRLHEKTNGLRRELDALAEEWSALPADAATEMKRAILTKLNTLLNTRNYLRTLLATIDAAIHGGPAIMH